MVTFDIRASYSCFLFVLPMPSFGGTYYPTPTWSIICAMSSTSPIIVKVYVDVSAWRDAVSQEHQVVRLSGLQIRRAQFWHIADCFLKIWKLCRLAYMQRDIMFDVRRCLVCLLYCVRRTSQRRYANRGSTRSWMRWISEPKLYQHTYYVYDRKHCTTIRQFWML